jgi:type II secretory pathway component PulC
MGGEPGAMSAPQPTGQQPPQGESAKPSLTLTGIVRGKPDMAILRKDDQRYFVKVGETVDGYRVQSISNQQVVLAGPQGKVTLRMGGRQ